MDTYKVGDKFLCPHDTSCYTLKKMGEMGREGLYHFIVTNRHEEPTTWVCGDWYLEQCILGGDLIFCESDPEFDEDLFHV